MPRSIKRTSNGSYCIYTVFDTNYQVIFEIRKMSSLKQLVSPFIYNSLVALRIHDFVRNIASRNLKILMYHGIIDDDCDIECWWLLRKSAFIRQVEYITNYFHIISLDQACDYMLHHNKIPDNSMVVTFDDGYTNYLTEALPILKKYNVPSTIYIPTGPIERGSLIWADQLYWFLYNNWNRNIKDIVIRVVTIESEKSKEEAIKSIIDYLKTKAADERDLLTKKLFSYSNGYSYEHSSMLKNPFTVLSIEDVKILSHEELVTIGSHTVEHEILCNMPLDRAISEISYSKEILEEWIKRPVEHFSYPAGFMNDELAKEVMRAGYKSAMLAGCFHKGIKNMYYLPRIGIGAFDSEAFFKLNVNGFFGYKECIRAVLFGD